MKVLSLSPTGNGAHVVHSLIAKHLNDYTSVGYSPWITLMPYLLSHLGKNHRASIVHAPLDYACFFKRDGVPLIATAHNFVLDDFMRNYSTRLQRLHYQTDLAYFTRRSLDMASCVTAVSNYTAGIIRSEMSYASPIPVIYNGIDETAFTPEIKKSDISKRKIFRILFSGNLTLRKQFTVLPKLAETLGAGFEIVCAGGLNSKVLRENGFSDAEAITYLGRVPYEEMPAVYNSVDALFMPSVREGFGLAVVEAMACGLPVVANNCSSIPELFQDKEGGFLCEVGNLSQYVDAFRALSDDERLCHRMGGVNRGHVEKKFTLSRMVSEYQCLFEKVCDNNV